jgi:hypothetical protein
MSNPGPNECSSSEYHPVFGSLLASLASIILAFVVWRIGMSLFFSRDYGRFGYVFFFLGIMIGLQGIFGLVFGFDLWSVLRWF